MAYEHGRGRDSPGIDHLGGIVLPFHSRGIAGFTGPAGRPPVAYGFGGSRNIDARDQEPDRKDSSSGGPATRRSVRLLIPERTFGFDLRALPHDRDHRGTP